MERLLIEFDVSERTGRNPPRAVLPLPTQLRHVGFKLLVKPPITRCPSLASTAQREASDGISVGGVSQKTKMLDANENNQTKIKNENYNICVYRSIFYSRIF
jgi:hypothetical protein